LSATALSDLSVGLGSWGLGAKYYITAKVVSRKLGNNKLNQAEFVSARSIRELFSCSVNGGGEGNITSQVAVQLNA